MTTEHKPTIKPECETCGAELEPAFDYLGPDSNDMDGEAWGETDEWECPRCQNTNGPEGPLVTATRGEIVSALPHRHGLKRDNVVRVSNSAIALGLSRPLAVFRERVLPMLRRQAGEPFAVLLRCHLKPPTTRGTLTRHSVPLEAVGVKRGI